MIGYYRRTLPRREMMTLMAAGIGLATLAPAFADDRMLNSQKDGVAIKGYDTTAYFKQDKALKGAKENVVEWNGVKWHFVTASEAEAFKANPEGFAPQFGGFCTRAMSFGNVIPADPEVWRIYDGKLYMFALPRGGVFFDKGPQAMIIKAQANWDKL